MKNKLQNYYVFLFVALILLPCVIFALVRNHVDTTNYENTAEAEFPVIGQTLSDGTKVTIDNFPSLFEDWFNDHLPFKNQMLTLNSWFDYAILHTSSSDEVIVGKDGWLFYNGDQVSQEDPIANYQGTDLFTDAELETIAANMEKAEEVVNDEGAEFIIYFAPNKERVYSEYMPDVYGEPAENNRMQQLIDYLRENTDITVISAYDDLMEFKESHPDVQLYYKYDTHWNNVGAYIGTKTLCEALGEDFTDYDDLTVYTKDNAPDDVDPANFDAHYDLSRMIHLGNYLDSKDTVEMLAGFTKHGILLDDSDTEGLTQFHYYIKDANGDEESIRGNLMVIGDSFSAISAQYYGKNYQNTYITYYYNYDKQQLEDNDPEVVVYESVERYIQNMLYFDIDEGYNPPEGW